MTLGTLDLVEDQVRPALDGFKEVLEHRKVRCLVTIGRGGCEHQPCVAGRTSRDMAVDALRLHDRAGDVVIEYSARRLGRRRDASPRQPVGPGRGPSDKWTRYSLPQGTRLRAQADNSGANCLRLNRTGSALEPLVSRLTSRRQHALQQPFMLLLLPEALLLGLVLLVGAETDLRVANGHSKGCS